MSKAEDGRDREREVRFVLRRLNAGAQLEATRDGGWQLVGRRARRMVADELIALLRGRGFIDAANSLSEAGRGWLLRGADEFAAQHRVLTTRLVKDERGREHYVVVNAAESPIALLRRRGLIGAREFEAGERLRSDFTLAQLAPRLGVDYSAPVGRRSQKPELLITETALAAKQRFNRAMRVAGPGLADVLFDVCCMLKGIEESERVRNWPRSSGRVVLRIALERLAGHYGMRAPRAGRIRSWRKEAAPPQ